MLLSSCSERNPIGRRTETDWTADGIRSDGGRKPIGQRTEPDWTADGNGRGCSCLSCTNQANRQSIAAVSTAPTKPTEQSIPAVSARLCRLSEQELHQPSLQNNLFQLSPLGFAACQSKNCTNQANDTNVGGYGILAVVTQPSTQISFHRLMIYSRLLGCVKITTDLSD